MKRELGSSSKYFPIATAFPLGNSPEQGSSIFLSDAPASLNPSAAPANHKSLTIV